MNKQHTSFLILLPLLLLFSCGGQKEVSTEEVLRPVRYGKVIRSGGVAGQSFSGIAQPSMEAKLSFKVSGTINQLPVKVGDVVRKGQLIASLDARDYTVQQEQANAQLKSAQTQVKSAQAQLLNSKSTYDRVEKLYENNSVSLSEFEQAKTALEAAEASYEAAQAQASVSEAQVSSATNQVGYSRITAPFAGIITAVNVEANELVGSGAVVAMLTATQLPEVRVGVPEIFISRIEKGQVVSVDFSILPNKSFAGTVSEVGFSNNSGSTYPVIIRIDQPGSEIRPGMAATVNFGAAEASSTNTALIAPVAAVGEGAEGNFVYVLEEQGEAYLVKKQTVSIGQLFTNGFEITNGLQEGNLVATAGLNSLLDGMKVRLAE